MKKRGENQLSLDIGSGTAQKWEPHEHVRAGAARFAESQGRSVDYTGLDTLQYPTRAAYAGHKAGVANAGQPMTPHTAESYESLRRDVSAQFAHLTGPEDQGGMGFKFSTHDTDPYDTAEAMAADVGNKNIKVLSTKSTGPHSLLSDDENDQLRAVHDVFGHGATGRGFSRGGEEAAYQAHSQMFDPKSQSALGSELRNQTSSLIFTGDFPANAPVNLPDSATKAKMRKM